jgi:hypothetical protein
MLITKLWLSVQNIKNGWIFLQKKRIESMTNLNQENKLRSKVNYE